MLRSAALPLVVLALVAAAPPAHADGVFPLPGIRVTGGAVWHVDPERDAVGAVDVLPNVQLMNFDDELTMALLVGYGFEGGGDTHLFVIGADLGVLPSRYFGATVGLRGVLGSVDGDFGGGVRAVVGTDLWYGVFRVEAGYQLLSGNDGAEHDLRVTAGVDLLRLLVAPLLLIAEDF